MAHVWSLGNSGCWVATPVGSALTLLEETPDLVEEALGATPARERVLLRRLPDETWALLCPPSSGVRVNGEPVPLGLTILSDRDELGVPGCPARFFSTEITARVEAFPETAEGGYCPRCRQAMDSGSTAVRCPACGLWHHETGELPCWSYAATCAGGCGHDTAMDAGFRWTPEEL